MGKDSGKTTPDVKVTDKPGKTTPDVKLTGKHGQPQAAGGGVGSFFTNVNVAAQTYSSPTVFGDPATQSIGIRYAQQLTAEGLREEIEYITGLLDTAAQGSAERQSLEGNLAVLAEEAEERGVEVPLLVTRALEQAARKWGADMLRLTDELRTIANTKLGRHYDPFSAFFPDNINWGVDQATWMVEAMGGAVSLARVAQWLPSPMAEPMYRAAGTRYMAALMGSQLFHVWLAYLHVGVAALEPVTPIDIEFLIRTYWDLEKKQLQPLLDDLMSLDEARVNSASARVAEQLPVLRAEFEKWLDLVKESIEHAQKVMKALAIVQIAMALIGGIYAFESGGPALFTGAPGITTVSATGTATMQIVVSVEWVEAIRRLVEAGAIAAPALASLNTLIGMGGPQLGPMATPPGMMAVQTPSGTVTPTKGPDANTSVKYGDARGKHTRVGDEPVQDIKDAMANPGTGTPELQNMKANQGNGSYGSQLGKEAVDKYGDLVKDALENGTRLSNTAVQHTATFEVGVDIFSGQGTMTYRMYYSAHHGGWHIFPVL